MGVARRDASLNQIPRLILRRLILYLETGRADLGDILVGPYENRVLASAYRFDGENAKPSVSHE